MTILVPPVISITLRQEYSIARRRHDIFVPIYVCLSARMRLQISQVL